MRERYQGGSLAGFIIIGVLLTLVLVGGLYGLNRYNAEQSKEVATDDGGNSKEEKPSDNPDKKSSPESEPKNDKPAEQNSSESKDDKQTSKPSESTDNKSSTDKQLPVTGPADVVTAVVAVALLSFAGTHYLQSRIHRNH